MYFTDRSNDISYFQSDCLFYRILTNINLYYQDYAELIRIPDTIIPNHQSIAYCFRETILINDLLVFNNTNDEKISFFQLREKNISSEELYKWSIPIDIIEHYQFYLMNNISKNMFFYNCTLPYFGSFCQYQFFLNLSTTFSDIVQKTIMAKQGFYGFKNLTCYIYLNCIRGPAPICLDWREICDNKIDCLNGEDEEQCFDLELNECKENEYRCQNGQCIPKIFFQDNYFNPDCLDRTDEPMLTLLYPTLCTMDPSFRCEDLQCRPSKTRFQVCGDGECEEILGDCLNRRNLLFFYTIFKSSNVSKICQKVMQCSMGLVMQADDPFECTTICLGELCLKFIQLTCPDQYLFPSYPILYGHIRLMYIKKQINYFNEILFPNYICYDITLCNSLFSKSIYYFGQLTCVNFSEMINFNDIQSIFDWYSKLSEIFYSCSTSRNFSLGNQTHCYNSTLYHCVNTSKCISKHRLVDGIRDCQEGDDEIYPFNCSLSNKTQRFTCSNNETKCFKLHQYHNNIQDCINGEDELDSLIIDTEKKISFQTICDGFQELKPILIENYNLTDETNCEYWPCNNIYTRCDGIWNCQNGEDETNCLCKGQPCLSLTTQKLICLPASKIHDGNIDCIGGSDERQYCRIAKRNRPDMRFLCSGSNSHCVSVDNLCDTEKDCQFGDDEDHCEHFMYGRYDFICLNRFNSYNMTDIEYFLCQLTERSKQKIIYFSLNPKTSLITSSNIPTRKITKRSNFIDGEEITRKLELCNRGLPVDVRYVKDKNIVKCLCPPAYYGNICQYQNERISLTLKLKSSPPDWFIIFSIVIMLIDNQQGLIEFVDQLIYNHFKDCQIKFDVNLLYSTRPKNLSKTYSIRIDAFNKQTLDHRSSWIFPIKFPYLPVYRLSVELNISLSETIQYCSFNCSNHGKCIFYENEKEKHFCLCDKGWIGLQCSKQIQCNCAFDAKCISTSLCICKTGTFGTRCLLTDTKCQSNKCQNSGTCHSSFPEDPTSIATCICPQGYSGRYCEKSDTKIIVKFIDISIPLNIHMHFIEIFESSPHLRSTTFKKSTIGQNNIILTTSTHFHLMFIEINSNYYLLYTNNSQNKMETTIETEVNSSKRCVSISELFNKTFAKQNLLIRIKYYHLICEKHQRLSCFYDEIHLCLCSINRQGNCFEFNHNMKYDCQGSDYCKNNAKCFQNNLNCPTSLICVCDDCYYGSRCQLSTIGFVLSLDPILGYHILQQKTFNQQTLSVKISTGITIILSLLGYISAICSLITFRRKKSRQVGCGFYLYTSSICLILMITLFLYKFSFLILSQSLIITNYSFLFINCLIIDYLLRSFLSLNDWLNACVSIERGISVTQGINFNKTKSIQIAKRIIFSIIILTFISHIHDPFHRDLMNDEEENRIWCITEYSSLIFHMFNTIITIIHFFIPFTINFLSALIIIIKAVQRQLNIEKQKLETIRQSSTNDDEIVIKQQQQRKIKIKILYKQLFYQEIREHKHILISPFVLILLALPRLIISFLSGCMKSQRDPWLFLIGYFVSFLPPIAHFVIFVLPSEIYKTEFSKAILRIRRRLHLI